MRIPLTTNVTLPIGHCGIIASYSLNHGNTYVVVGEVWDTNRRGGTIVYVVGLTDGHPDLEASEVDVEHMWEESAEAQAAFLGECISRAAIAPVFV